MVYPRIASLKNHEAFRERLDQLSLSLPSDAEVLTGSQSPLNQPCTASGLSIGNRFCILPMEGWDSTGEGQPTELNHRRWVNFGISGAKLIWGGEAVAVRHDGRANPNQLVATTQNTAGLASLRKSLVDAHVERFGDEDGLVIGLQLTHSGRWARPYDKSKPEPRIAFRHPVLDSRLGIDHDDVIFSDDELYRLIDDFVKAAVVAEQAGYDFVDVKHCHGYLGHELLSAIDRPGDFGGSLSNRTRFLRSITERIRDETKLAVGVRLSVFDFVPFCPGDDNLGKPEGGGEAYAFGNDGSGTAVDLAATDELLDLFEKMGIEMVCTTAGSPYYNPHIQRPAYFPPSDGYQPPEDPLVGVDRQVAAVAELKRRHPQMFFVGSGYTYLQDWLPNVAQAVVENGMADSIGLGRMVLSYPDLPVDVFEGRYPVRKKVCRTFSDCTTAPRKGMISGCYPLDPFYKERPERKQLLELKKA